jgi:hypothetical protein
VPGPNYKARRLTRTSVGCALLALASGTHNAWSEDLDFTIGVKLWAAEWSSWQPVQAGNSSNISLVQSIAANTTIAPIIQGSLRYGRWITAASYFIDTSYSLGGSIDTGTGVLRTLPASRHEVDANVGYFLVPGFAATLGYKQIEQNFGGSPYKWSGPTVGLSGGAPVYRSLSMYATFAYGHLNLSAPVPDASGSTSGSADYILGELGLSYGFDTPLRPLSLTVTLGYRIQIVSTRSFAVGAGLYGSEPVDIHDVTYGPAIGVSGRF